MHFSGKAGLAQALGLSIFQGTLVPRAVLHHEVWKPQLVSNCESHFIV